MAEDSYNNDLSTDGFDDEFDGLEAGPSKPKGKTSLLLALLCVIVLVGGGFFAYEIFMETPPPAPAAVNVAVTTPVPPAPVGTNGVPVPPGLSPAAASLPPVPASSPAVPGEAPVPGTAATINEPAIAAAATDEPAKTVTTTTTSVETTPAASVADAATTKTTVTTTAPDAALSPIAPAPTAPAADVAAPPVQQLKPIEPASVMSKAEGVKTDTDAKKLAKANAKTVETVEAVNEILGKPAGVTAETQKALAKQVEVTPRAHQVIVVKRNYSAQSSQAMNAAGDRVLNAGEYGDAVAIYDKQLKKNPSDPIALSGKAMALQKAGRDDEAMDVYKRLLDLNPRDIDALTNYVGLMQKQNPEQALTRLESLEQQYPDNAAIIGQKGMIYARQMDAPNAIRSFQKAAALDPTNPTYPFNLAVLYDRLGTTDKARAAYQNATGLISDNPDQADSRMADTIRNRLRELSNQ